MAALVATLKLYLYEHGMPALGQSDVVTLRGTPLLTGLFGSRTTAKAMLKLFYHPAEPLHFGRP